MRNAGALVQCNRCGLRIETCDAFSLHWEGDRWDLCYACYVNFDPRGEQDESRESDMEDHEILYTPNLDNAHRHGYIHGGFGSSADDEHGQARPIRERFSKSSTRRRDD